jgi:hypothetical protein
MGRVQRSDNAVGLTRGARLGWRTCLAKGCVPIFAGTAAKPWSTKMGLSLMTSLRANVMVSVAKLTDLFVL